MVKGGWNDRVRYGSFFHNSLDHIVIAIGDKYGKTFKRSMHYFCYPGAVSFNTIINSTMLYAKTWER